MNNFNDDSTEIQHTSEDLTIAVLIPCYNEAAAITTVIRDFQVALPRATIYVFDNNSTDFNTCTVQSAFIGDGSFPYKWCEVHQN